VSAVVLVATLLLVLLFVLLEGFFSGSETGIYVVNRIRLRLRAEAGQREAQRLRHLLADTKSLITTALVGTNLCVFGSSALMTRLLERRFGQAALVSTLILSPALFVFAEVVPKNLFRRHADVLMYRVSGGLRLSGLLFRPLVVALKGVTAVWGVLLGEVAEPADPLRSRDRLLSLLMTGTEEGILTPYQHDVAGNILRVASVPVEAVRIPIDEVATIETPLAPERVIEALNAHGHSRYPVRAPDGSIQTILDVTAYLMAWRRDGRTDAGCTAVLRLAADTPVPRALEVLQTARLPLALVVDQADRTLGIVTAKDLVEEIVGELAEW
jgi:putative hemolysin